MIDWASNTTEIVLNPRYAPVEKKRYYSLLQSLEGFSSHVWLATSGTSGMTKFVALSKKAILTSATGVNQHLKSDASDVWLNALPDFHVGGLGIQARSYLSGASFVDYKSWDPRGFCDLARSYKATLTALVPTQLFDLVLSKEKAPASLRAVIIGGGALDETLYEQARLLGWPVLPSYGLTECSSQVATAVDSRKLQLLPHVSVKIQEGFICIKSDALLSAYALWNEDRLTVLDPKVEGWFQTEDRGELQGSILTVFGRGSDFIKIGGESVDMLQLEAMLNRIKLNLEVKEDMLLVAACDPRLGKVIHLQATGNVENVVREFNGQVLPFARIREVHLKEKIARTELGKPVGRIY